MYSVWMGIPQLDVYMQMIDMSLVEERSVPYVIYKIW